MNNPTCPKCNDVGMYLRDDFCDGKSPWPCDCQVAKTKHAINSKEGDINVFLHGLIRNQPQDVLDAIKKHLKGWVEHDIHWKIKTKEGDTCPECKGKGWWATYVCPGTNWVDCPYCEQTGKVRPMVACELCDDSGMLFRTFSNGTSKLQTCYLCDGKKVIIKPLDEGEATKSPHDNPADIENLNREYPLPD